MGIYNSPVTVSVRPNELSEKIPWCHIFSRGVVESNPIYHNVATNFPGYPKGMLDSISHGLSKVSCTVF